jgi:hypothetical protein
VLAGSTIYLMPGFTVVAGSAGTTFTAMAGTPPVLSITTASLPSGTAGASYGAVSLAAIGGSGSYAWSATALPSGLTLSAAGQLSGTPLSAGTQFPGKSLRRLPLSATSAGVRGPFATSFSERVTDIGPSVRERTLKKQQAAQ